MANRPSLTDQNIGVFFGGGTKKKEEKPVAQTTPPKANKPKKETQPKPQPKQKKQEKPIKQVAQPVKQVVQPKPQTAELTASKRGLKNGWSRATFIMRDDHLDKLKALAYWDRKTIIDVITEMADSYLKNKSPKPIPPK